MNEELIDARKLKAILLNKSQFSDWIKRNIKKNRLIENKDFFLKKEEIMLLKSKTIRFNYFLTAEASKKIIINATKNKIARRYKEKD